MSLELPKAEVEVQDGGLGLVDTPSEDVYFGMGCTSKGTLLLPFSVATLERLKADYGAGPGVKQAAYSIGKTSASVIFARLAATARAAQKNGLTISGAQTVTLSGTPNEGYDIVLVCTLGGTIGSAPGPSFKWSKDGGENFATPVSLGAGTTLVLTGTGLTANFTATNIFAADDQITAWTVPAAQSVGPVTTTRANTGSPSTSVVTLAGTPIDDYEPVLVIDEGGTIGTTGIKYRYSLDAGRTFSLPKALGTATTILPLDGAEASGLTWSLAAGTLDTNDKFEAKAFGPDFAAADAVTAIDNVMESQHEWRFIQFAGWKSKSDIATIASRLQDLQTSDDAKPTFGLFSARPRGTYEKESNWEARLLAEFAGFDDNRTGVAAGRARMLCPVTGRQDRRTVLVPIVARLVSKTLQVDPGRRLDGPLGSDVQLYDENKQRTEHDARRAPALHGARFLTLRTYVDRGGTWCTRGNLMTEGDFNRIAYRAVMDLATFVFNAVMLEQIENHLFANPAVGGDPGATPGAIRETDARTIDRELVSALEVALRGYVSGVQARVSRTDPFLSTGELTADVKLVPLGYVDKFSGKIAFVNPKFAAFQVA